MKNKVHKIDMTKVSKESMEHYIQLRKEYAEKKQKGINDELLFQICENFIVNVINKDKEYYSKLSMYGFSNDDLMYCLWSNERGDKYAGKLYFMWYRI